MSSGWRGRCAKGDLGAGCSGFRSGFERCVILPGLASKMHPEVSDMVDSLDFLMRPAGTEHPIPDANAPVAHGLAEVMSSWRGGYNLLPDGCVPVGWRVWLPIGRAMVSGVWPGDMVSVVKCEREQPRLLPAAPGRLAELLYLDKLEPPGHESPRRRTPAHTASDIFGQTSKWGPRVKQFHPIHISNALGASAELKQIARLNVSLKRHLRFAFPCDFDAVGARLQSQGFRVPSRHVLERGRIRLDVVAMVLNRRHRPRAVASRSLSYDSSPQGGQELFACVEVVVVQGQSGVPSSSQRRSMPMTQMGHGCTGVIAKAMNLIHKVGLEIGFEQGGLEDYFKEVRGCVTDCGAEWGVVEMPNVIGQFLSKQAPSFASAGRLLEDQGPLMPNSMRFPGWSHSHDWCLKRSLVQLPFWSQYLDEARLMCWFLNNTSYREVLCKNLKDFVRTAGTLETAQLDMRGLESFHANFAHWRFGTMALVSRRLSRVKKELQHGFRVESFACQDAGKLAQVERIIRGDTFWQRNAIVDMVAQRNEDARQWGLGCVCHARECKSAAKAGQRYICWKKGLSAKYLLGKVRSLCQGWEEESREVASLEWGSTEYSMLAQEALAHLASSTSLRFGFCKHIPWLLCAARSVDIAWECIQQFDEQAESFQRRQPGAAPPHRVSERFCGRGSALQEAFHAFAEGRGMTPLLSDELIAYELCAIDESMAEGEHRNATYQRQRAPGSRFGWWAASCRMAANLELVEKSVEKDGGREFIAAWHGWKCLFRPSSRSQVVFRPERICTKLFVDKVYRLREIGMEAWVGVSGPLKDAKIPKQKAATRAEARKLAVIKDWAQCVFKQGQFYAVPVERDHRISQLEGVAVAGGSSSPAELAVGRTISSCRVFKVLEAKLGALRLAFDACCSYQVPLFVQWFSAWNCTNFDPTQPTALSVFPDGEPCIVDGCAIAEFSVMCTIVWYQQRSLSDVYGCVALSLPAGLLDQDFGKSYLGVPLFAMLEGLRAVGWSPGQRFDPHLPGDDHQVYDMPFNCIALKGYYACLRKLGELFSEGLAALHVRQRASYYALCMRSANKALCLPDQPAQVYNEMLRDEPETVQQKWLVADAVLEGMAEDGIAMALEDELIVEPPSRVPGGKASERRSPRTAAAAAGAAQSTTSAPKVGEGGLLHCGGEVVLTTSESGSHSDGNSSAASSAGAIEVQGGGMEQLAERPVAEGGSGVAQDSSPQRLRPLPRPVIPEIVLGVPVRLENVQPADGRPAYQRLVTTCPLSSSSHFDDRVCKTSRKLGGLCTARFGAIEAVGFLGCWLAKGEHCASRTEHLRCKPTPSEVEAFMRQHGLLAPGG